MVKGDENERRGKKKKKKIKERSPKGAVLYGGPGKNQVGI